jgi:hypothetical protein
VLPVALAIQAKLAAVVSSPPLHQRDIWILHGDNVLMDRAEKWPGSTRSTISLLPSEMSKSQATKFAGSSVCIR